MSTERSGNKYSTDTSRMKKREKEESSPESVHSRWLYSPQAIAATATRPTAALVRIDLVGAAFGEADDVGVGVLLLLLPLVAATELRVVELLTVELGLVV